MARGSSPCPGAPLPGPGAGALRHRPGGDPPGVGPDGPLAHRGQPVSTSAPPLVSLSPSYPDPPRPVAVVQAADLEATGPHPAAVAAGEPGRPCRPPSGPGTCAGRPMGSCSGGRRGRLGGARGGRSGPGPWPTWTRRSTSCATRRGRGAVSPGAGRGAPTGASRDGGPAGAGGCGGGAAAGGAPSAGWWRRRRLGPYSGLSGLGPRLLSWLRGTWRRSILRGDSSWPTRWRQALDEGGPPKPALTSCRGGEDNQAGPAQGAARGHGGLQTGARARWACTSSRPFRGCAGRPGA